MFSGSMVALVTPMRADGSLDGDCLNKLVEFHISSGTDAIVAMGTTGESATLNVEEHLSVVQQVVQQVNGRVPVIAGTGANSTSGLLQKAWWDSGGTTINMNRYDGTLETDPNLKMHIMMKV